MPTAVNGNFLCCPLLYLYDFGIYQLLWIKPVLWCWCKTDIGKTFVHSTHKTLFIILLYINELCTCLYSKVILKNMFQNIWCWYYFRDDECKNWGLWQTTAECFYFFFLHLLKNDGSSLILLNFVPFTGCKSANIFYWDFRNALQQLVPILFLLFISLITIMVTLLEIGKKNKLYPQWNTTWNSFG